jgi:hypothetical protein
LFKITNMKVPYSEQAYIESEKLTQYLLNFDHPDGASKAAFYAAMGFDLSNADELEAELLRLIDENEINTIEKISMVLNMWSSEHFMVKKNGHGF